MMASLPAFPAESDGHQWIPLITEEHTVRAGENLSEILSDRGLGGKDRKIKIERYQRFLQLIRQRNPDIDALDKIRVGQTVWILAPRKKSSRPARATEELQIGGRPTPVVWMYVRLKHSDTLASVLAAKEQYWTKRSREFLRAWISRVLEMNPRVEDPNRLAPGTQLFIPFPADSEGPKVVEEAPEPVPEVSPGAAEAEDEVLSELVEKRRRKPDGPSKEKRRRKPDGPSKEKRRRKPGGPIDEKPVDDTSWTLSLRIVAGYAPLLVTPATFQHLSYRIPTRDVPGTLWGAEKKVTSLTQSFKAAVGIPLTGWDLMVGGRYGRFPSFVFDADYIANQRNPYVTVQQEASAFGVWSAVRYPWLQWGGLAELDVSAGLDVDVSDVTFRAEKRDARPNGEDPEVLAKARSGLTLVSLRLGTGIEAFVLGPLGVRVSTTVLVPLAPVTETFDGTVSDPNGENMKDPDGALRETLAHGKQAFAAEASLGAVLSF